MEQKWLRQVRALQELKRNTGASSLEFKEGLEKLNHSVFSELCDKPYQTECDPSYCTPRYTSTCEYLKVWHQIEKQLEL